ncbi:hypothetical protein [Donghicola sp. XS_ASV15]|uniref:hypothetical protein n=1 Tax=Donghicola sp. XS_ASV15 TaxID=3241295 RepID=UPI0035115414
MFALLLEHGDIKSAKRALILSSCFQILVHMLQIEGEFFAIGGMRLSLSEVEPTKLSQTVVIYFLVFFSLFSFLKVQEDASVALKARNEAKRQAAKNTLDQYCKTPEEIEEEERDDLYEPETWEKAYSDELERISKTEARFEKIRSITTYSIPLIIEILFPIALGLSVVFFPQQIANIFN